MQISTSIGQFKHSFYINTSESFKFSKIQKKGNKMNNSNILNTEAAGRYLGGADSPISIRSMQRYRHQGIGPKFKLIGKQVRYRKSDLDEYLDECTCASTST
jgi:predicted DNA-binding transcriptional regulator AlpA